ncbi:hypothetical protein [Brevibacillus brevis]|uniref:Uncharacterized protein n=1 Tax=Brevibacillus brevis TaxID=1393 RepID=A0ABY9TCT7_BREBE|nr:hypothetical protein [Brevibacillus brevis]WNC17925.1 hypothetical protein RGB73_30180 [Brevibacillus brevis]
MNLTSTFVLIYEPVFLLIAIPDENSEISYQDFKVWSKDDDEDLRFCYMKLFDGATVPPHVMDAIADSDIRQIAWENLCITGRSLAATIAECLLRIGVRVLLT